MSGHDNAEATDANPVIGLLPYDLEANSYIAKTRALLSELGTVQSVPSPPLLFKRLLKQLKVQRKFKLYDVLIVNWRENCLVTSGRITASGILEYFASLLLHRFSSRTLVYVRHNKSPHGLPSSQQPLARRLMKLGERFADFTVVHSPADVDGRKCRYIPHPLYDLNQRNHDTEMPESGYDFLMIGRIQRYKNIHRMVERWDTNLTLGILGPCSDPEYLDSLKDQAKGNNVFLEVDFHSEAYLAHRVQQATGVIVINDTSSMIVSGSLLFALSCNTPVLVNDSPFWNGFDDADVRTLAIRSKDIDDLITKIVTDQIGKKSEDSLSRAQVINRLFGDETVKQHWSALFSEVAGTD